MRKNIMKQNRTLWLQGEAILFLTILKHSGLLHLNLKFSIQYIKENLKAFEDARDEGVGKGDLQLTIAGRIFFRFWEISLSGCCQQL